METNRKRCKVHMLPTEDRTLIRSYGETLFMGELGVGYFGAKPQHLYITSDDEIKEGDLHFNSKYGDEIRVANKRDVLSQNYWRDEDYEIRKIIATTDSSLKLPQPSKAFIEKYCKVGGIDEVDVEIECVPADRAPNGWDCGIKVDSHNTITIHPIKDSWSRDELQYYLSEFGNYLRDNYYGVGAPKLIPLTKGLSSGTVDEILEKWIKENL